MATEPPTRFWSRRSSALDNTTSGASRVACADRGVQTDETRESLESVYGLRERLSDLQSAHHDFRDQLLREISETITRTTLAIRDDYHTQFTELERQFRGRVDTVRQSAHALYRSESAAAIGTFVQEATVKRDAETQAVAEDTDKMKKRVSTYSTESAYHVEAVRVLQQQLSSARNLLQKHNIAFDVQPVTLMQHTDPFVLEDEIAKLKQRLSESEAATHAKALELKAVTLQLKVLRGDRQAFEQRHAAEVAQLREELRELKGGANARLRARIEDEVRERYMEEYRAEQRRTADEMRRSMAQITERCEKEALARTRTMAQQLEADQRAHEVALQRRDEDHAQEIAKLNSVWEKKMSIVNEGLASLRSAEATAALSERQARIMQLALALQSRGSPRASMLPPIS
eukprot:m.16522 g.16522  ORF g.16522 m.16522 type:complete len:403 (+) comp3149_c0_seq2:3-1211(+)